MPAVRASSKRSNAKRSMRMHTSTWTIYASTLRNSSNAITTSNACILHWGYQTPEELETQSYARDKAGSHSATLRFFSGDPQKVTTALVGEGTQTPSLPHTPYRAWRISEMTSNRNPRINLYEPEFVSPEGSELKNAAGVAKENCLNEGVHPTCL